MWQKHGLRVTLCFVRGWELSQNLFCRNLSRTYSLVFSLTSQACWCKCLLTWRPWLSAYKKRHVLELLWRTCMAYLQVICIFVGTSCCASPIFSWSALSLMLTPVLFLHPLHRLFARMIHKLNDSKSREADQPFCISR